MLDHDLHDRRPVERQLAGEDLVEHDAAGVEVGAGVGLLPLEHLRGEVLGGAHDEAGLGLRRGEPLDGTGNAEVHELGVAGGLQDHVLGLDVAVQHAHGMGGAETRAELLGQAQARRIGQPARLVQHVAQGHAADVLHGDVGHAVDLAEVVGAQDVGMGDLARQLDLALQAVELVAVPPQLPPQHLEGHEVVELPVAGLVDDAHAAGPEHREDLEALPQQGPGRDAGEGGARRRAQGLGVERPLQRHAGGHAPADHVEGLGGDHPAPRRQPVAGLLEGLLELRVHLAGEQQLAGGGLAQQALEHLHGQAHQGPLRPLAPGDRPGDGATGGEGHHRRLGLVSALPVERRAQHLRGHGQGAVPPPVALEAGDDPVAGDGLHLPAAAGHGGGHPLEVAGQPLQRLLRIAAGAGVLAQLDAQQHHLPALRLAQQGPRLLRLGEVARELGDVLLHVPLLPQVRHQLLEGLGEAADLVAAAGLDLLIVVPLAGGLGGGEELAHGLESAAGEGEGEERGDQHGREPRAQEHVLDLPVDGQRVLQRGQGHGGAHRFARGVEQRRLQGEPGLAAE